MSGVNKVILLGRLGQDPEVRMTPSGQQVCKLRLATSETWMKEGQKEEKTEWHTVVLWARQAELAGKFLRKGRNVYVEGRLQTRSWDGPDGQKRYATEVVATQMQFVDSAGSRNDSSDASLNDPMSDGGGGSGQYGMANQSSSFGYDSPSPANRAASSQTFRASDMDDDVPF